MAKLNVRNRNKDKFYKDGRPKPPNWEYRFEGAKINGKRIQISDAGYRTKKDAEIAGTKALAEYNNAGQHFVPSEMSVSDFFDYWLKNYSEVNQGDNTTSGYETIISKYIKPRLGAFKLKSIDTCAMQEFINSICTENDFSREYISTILKVLKQGFKYAHKKAKFIQVNPAEDVELPNMDIEEHKDILTFTKDQVQTMLNHFVKSPHQYYAMLIAYYTGLRISEVYGLTWDCINFESETLTVNKAIKSFNYDYKKGESLKGKRGRSTRKWYYGSCKTKSSYRTIKIGKTLINALSDYREWQEKNESFYGEYYLKSYIKDVLSRNRRKVQLLVQTTEQLSLIQVKPVCIKENGNFSGTDSMRHPSKVINAKLGIPFKFHGFRHTHATMLIEQGVPIKVVSERLGHSNTTITWSTYVKVTQTMEEEAARTFEKEGELHLRDEELYSLWKQTINKKNILYYKQKNISICDEWLDYSSFEKWVGENGWKSGLRLLRIDKSGNYSPENCMIGKEIKSVKGGYIYCDGEHLKSYSVRKIGRGYQYRISHYNEQGKRIDISKAGFKTEDDAAIAAEAVINDLLEKKKNQNSG
ncbi:MAG: tyrosine-type recombinase/integrase [Lachnospiraceae bacterium]